MSGLRREGVFLVRRPSWPVALETLLMRELVALWDSGHGELLIDSAWVSNFSMRSVSPHRFAAMFGLPRADTLTFSLFLANFLRLGGAVRMMFREDHSNPTSIELSRSLVRDLEGVRVGLRDVDTWRIQGTQLQIRTHPREHNKRLLSKSCGYVGSANLTATGLYRDRDDAHIVWGDVALRPYVNAFLSDWESADALPEIESRL